MTRFREFTYDELNNMEEALYNAKGLKSLAIEIRKEKEYREELGRLARKAYEECADRMKYFRNRK